MARFINPDRHFLERSFCSASFNWTVKKMKAPMMFIACLLAILGFTSSFKMEDHGHVLPDDEFARSLFQKLDANTDNNLVFEEFLRIFTSMDLDVDGKVTKTEFLTLWLAEGLGHANHAMAIFSEIDTNKDDLLDLVDIRRFYSYFDNNGDQKVNDVEFVTTWIAMESSF